MALADYAANVKWQHYCDSLTQDFPTTGITRSNPGILTDPTATGGYLDYNKLTANLYTAASPLFNVGSGDFTVLAMLRIDTAVLADAIFDLFDGGGNSSGIILTVASGSGGSRILRFDNSNSLGSASCDTGSSVWTDGQDLMVAFRRISGVCTVWADSDATGGFVNQSATDGWNTRSLNHAGNVVMGSNYAASASFDGRIYWLLEIAQGVTDADLGNGALWSESALKAAFLSAGGGFPPVPAPLALQSQMNAMLVR